MNKMKRGELFKTVLSSILILVMLSVLLVGASAEVLANETDKANTPALTNIGFMRNPPKELKEKFPMCDAFLKVEWIDKEKKIGYSNYEAKIKGKKRMIWALVSLNDEAPSRGLDVYQYKRQGRLKEIFEMFKYGKIEGGGSGLISIYKGKSVTIYNRVPDDDSLADHRCTVCIPYPDEQMVWIAEGKSVGQTYSEPQRKELSDRIKETSGRSFNNKWLESLWILDINFDGKEDFVLKRSFAATWSNKLYLGDSNYNYKDQEFQQIFPPSGRSCRISSLGRLPLTTDGKNYYISNQCNLTKLTSNPGKE